MKVAIVGAGVSGLVVAHLLQREHAVTVFEAGGYAGGHTNTVAVKWGGESHQIDTGFIVFNDRNYPNFERLLGSLGVSSQVSDMSFGVSDRAGRFEYAATGFTGLFATRRNLVSPAFYRMVAEVPRFQKACRRLLESRSPGPSLRGWLAAERFSPRFVEQLIVPQVAAVWSADPGQMSSFPARFLAEFFDNHGMLSLRERPIWRVVQGGSRRYVEALLARFSGRILLDTPVFGVRRLGGGVEVTAVGREPELFEQVVIATHSDQALGMLSDPSPLERELLGAIPFQANEAVLHTDKKMMPRRWAAWASWNYHLLDPAPARPTMTYHMNRLQSLDSRYEFLVTLNRTAEIDPAKVIAKFHYAHPVYTATGVAAQRRVAEISGVNHTHYCGAYWGWGFHEDGVVSALRVGEAFGARL